jgi:hypothetical protein
LRASLICTPLLLSGCLELLALQLGAAVALKTAQIVGEAFDELTRAPQATQKSERFRVVGNAKFRDLGRIDAGDALPQGTLHQVVYSQTVTSKDVIQGGVLMVNFDAPSAMGEWSYLSVVTANCNSGALTVHLKSTFDQPDSKGSQESYDWLSHPLAIDRPSAPLARAVQAICEQRK